jgi:hypothetical protein
MVRFPVMKAGSDDRAEAGKGAMRIIVGGFYGGLTSSCPFFNLPFPPDRRIPARLSLARLLRRETVFMGTVRWI